MFPPILKIQSLLGRASLLTRVERVHQLAPMKFPLAELKRYLYDDTSDPVSPLPKLEYRQQKFDGEWDCPRVGPLKATPLLNG
jgi:hypothetical protein